MLVSNQECQSSMSLRWGILVFNGSPMKYVEVSDGSTIMHIGLRWGMWVSKGLRWSMSKYPMALQSGMSVSDGSPIIIIFSWTHPFRTLFQHIGDVFKLCIYMHCVIIEMLSFYSSILRFSPYKSYCRNILKYVWQNHKIFWKRPRNHGAIILEEHKHTISDKFLL